jgi:hypothetical protein
LEEGQGVLEVPAFHLEEEASSSLEEDHQLASSLVVGEEGEEVVSFQ